LKTDNCVIETEQDKVYRERNRLAALCGVMALKLGFKAGVKKHQGDDFKKDRENIIYIDLPTGQISYHIKDCELNIFEIFPDYNDEFDGHDFDEKYKRILEYIKQH